MDAAQEDINAASARIGELTQQINDLLASNNDYLVCFCNAVLSITFLKFCY